MALVKCPECGREVSDTAISCPGCGYAVKEHFAKNGVVKKEDEPVKISAKLVECKKCGAKLNQGTEMCFKCGVSLEQKGNSENNTINNRKPEPENQVTIGLGLVALAFVSLFLPFMQLGYLALSLAQIQLVLPILGVSLGLTAIFIISKKKSGVIAMNVFSILFTAFVYYGEFVDNSGVSRFVSPGIGAFLLPIALIAIWVYYAKLRKEYGLAPNEKPIKGGRIVLGVILGIIILVALIVVVGLIRKAMIKEVIQPRESVVDTGVEETAKVEETKKEEPKQEAKKETKVETTEETKQKEADNNSNKTTDEELDSGIEPLGFYGTYSGQGGTCEIGFTTDDECIDYFNMMEGDLPFSGYLEFVGGTTWYVRDYESGKILVSIKFEAASFYLKAYNSDSVYTCIEGWYSVVEWLDLNNVG